MTRKGNVGNSKNLLRELRNVGFVEKFCVKHTKMHHPGINKTITLPVVGNCDGFLAQKVKKLVEEAKEYESRNSNS